MKMLSASALFHQEATPLQTNSLTAMKTLRQLIVAVVKQVMLLLCSSVGQLDWHLYHVNAMVGASRRAELDC